MIKKIFNEKSEDYEIYEDWVDAELNCIKCDRFIGSISKEGFCLECAEEEGHELAPLQGLYCQEMI